MSKYDVNLYFKYVTIGNLQQLLWHISRLMTVENFSLLEDQFWIISIMLLKMIICIEWKFTEQLTCFYLSIFTWTFLTYFQSSNTSDTWNFWRVLLVLLHQKHLYQHLNNFELMHLWNLNNFCLAYFQESKDRIIQQLTKELEYRDRLCQQYRRQLFSLLETVEEQTESLSKNVELVVNNIKNL